MSLKLNGSELKREAPKKLKKNCGAQNPVSPWAVLQLSYCFKCLKNYGEIVENDS